MRMLETLIADTNVTLPNAVDEALRVTGAKLLGELLAIPESWADANIPTDLDTTEARSIISHALADASAKGLVRDPDIVAALTSVVADDLERKLRNRAIVFEKAVTLLIDGTIPSDGHAAAPGDDWLNAFQRVSEDADSEKLRDRLARILAGEINRSGSYSLLALRIVSELDDHIETCFSGATSESFDKVHIYRSEKYDDFAWWNKINTLRDVGLVSVADGSIHNPPVHLGAPDGIGYWSIGGEPAVMVRFRGNTASEIPVFKLTRVGMEVATLFPAPDFEKNLRFMVEDNPYKSGWVEANLLVGGKTGETIYAG
jgi:hypothetical protein